MPSNYIDRELELNEIIETYSEEEPSIRAYALTGLRGCGKTVALSFVEKYFQKREDILIDKRYGKIDFTLPRFKEITCRNIVLGFWAK